MLVVYLVDLETYEVVEQLVVCLQFLSCNLHQLFVSWVVFVVSTFESLNVVVGSFRHCSLCVPCSGVRFSCQNFLGLCSYISRDTPCALDVAIVFLCIWINLAWLTYAPIFVLKSLWYLF